LINAPIAAHTSAGINKHSDILLNEKNHSNFYPFIQNCRSLTIDEKWTQKSTPKIETP